MKVKPNPVPHRESGALIVELGPGNKNLLFQEWNADDPAPFRDLFGCADQIQSLLTQLRDARRAHFRERESDLALNRWKAFRGIRSAKPSLEDRQGVSFPVDQNQAYGDKQQRNRGRG
jgi:hypothetical protein